MKVFSYLLFTFGANNKTKRQMETIEQPKPKPSFGNSFSQGWVTMQKYFLILFLVTLVLFIIMGPPQSIRWNINPSHGHHPWDWWHFPGYGLIALGMVAVLMILIGLAYSFLIVPIFKFGGRMMFVQAVRDIRPDFNLLVSGFRENYLGIVLANLLVVALVMLGTILLIIPGIIVACRLAFVSYLVMDKKLDPIQAVEESWRLTRGYGWTVFFMAIVSFFIFIAGICLLVVGIFPAAIWVSSSFAALYDSVQAEKSVAPVQA
jgi:MFS family permease